MTVDLHIYAPPRLSGYRAEGYNLGGNGYLLQVWGVRVIFPTSTAAQEFIAGMQKALDQALGLRP